eukprot:Pompholyxophrys_punicea_v1_NODE_1059_length_1003_cov_2.870253.p1 type:complete len:190 gc:universal NODE_1059_length_1003_cov_2.870253:790-221(-)
MVSERDVEAASEHALLRLQIFATLKTKQLEALIRFFCEYGSLLVVLPCGYGKSLVYQLIPFMWDYLYPNNYEASIVLVISPLKALMSSQARFLVGKGVKAVYVAEDSEIISQSDLINSKFRIVFASPESLLQTNFWHEIICSKQWDENLKCIVVDEAHCIVKYGPDFRPCYQNLKHLSALVPHVPLLLL